MRQPRSARAVQLGCQDQYRASASASQSVSQLPSPALSLFALSECLPACSLLDSASVLPFPSPPLPSSRTGSRANGVAQWRPYVGQEETAPVQLVRCIALWGRERERERDHRGHLSSSSM